MLTERPTYAMKLRCAKASAIIVKEVSISRWDFAELRHDLNITRSRRLSRAHPGEERAVMQALSWIQPTSENYEGLKVRIQQPIQDHRFNSMVYFEKIRGKKNYGKKNEKINK